MDTKLKRLTCSSQEHVIDEEDLLALILLRLPYRKLMSLKCVSKKWHSLITTPHFTRLLRNTLPPLRASALFFQSGADEVYFVPLDDRNATSPFKTQAFAHDTYNPRQIRILQSCNGLLLCSVFRLIHASNCYVYNPSTNHLDTLPKQPLWYGRGGLYIGLTYDPSKSLHYKVIAFVTTALLSRVGDLHIYSSETGTWKASIQSFRPPSGICFSDGVYWNGCMHWLPYSSVSNGLYFNVDEERFGKFPMPPIGAKDVRSLDFAESEDHLHVTKVCPYVATSLTVYEMKRDYSGWFVKYQIDLDPIAKFFSPTKTDYAAAVLSLIRRENFQEDSFLVLEILGKVIRYNLVDRSFKLIWEFRWTLGNSQVFQYIESVSCA